MVVVGELGSRRLRGRDFRNQALCRLERIGQSDVSLIKVARTHNLPFELGEAYRYFRLD